MGGQITGHEKTRYLLQQAYPNHHKQSAHCRIDRRRHDYHRPRLFYRSDILTNQFDKNDTFRITMEFETKGDALLGTLRRTSPSGSYDYAVGIVDGKIDGANISFFLPEQSLHGTEYVSYKNLYYGEVLDNKIDFTLQSDRPWGFKPIKFIATRQD